MQVAKAIDRRIIPLLLLASCSVERPVFQPTYDRLAGLKYFAPPAMPDLASEDTDDEAEIQFRAAFVFYDTARWSYAAAAFEEALDYDEDRHDIRFFLASSLLLANRDIEAALQCEELFDTPYEMRARALLARALLRMGKPEEARQAAAPAAPHDYDAAGWLTRFDLLTSSR